MIQTLNKIIPRAIQATKSALEHLEHFKTEFKFKIHYEQLLTANAQLEKLQTELRDAMAAASPFSLVGPGPDEKGPLGPVGQPGLVGSAGKPGKGAKGVKGVE